MKLAKENLTFHLSRWDFPALACLIAVQVILTTSCGKEEEKVAEEVTRPAKIETVKPTEHVSVHRMPGKVRASQRVELAFKVSGPLIELPVQEGQQVQKGELLARINPRDFETNLAKIKSAINEARAKFQAMKAGARPEDLKMLESEFSAAEARFREAEGQYKRYVSLYERKNVSKAEYDRFKAAYDVARAQLNTARQNLEKGKRGARKEDIEAMRANIQGLEAQQEGIRNALNDTYLRAPFSGVIAKKFVENFQEVQAKQPIVSLQDISRIEILVDVPEVFMARAKKGAVNAVVEFAAAPGKQYELSFKELSMEADPNTQTYRAVLEMPAPEGINILPGMTATVSGTARMDESAQSSTFLLPVNAIFADEAEKQYVWVVNPKTMRVKRREVKIGSVSGQGIRILGGLTAGEKIVTAGVHYLKDGLKVRELKRKLGE